MSVDVASLYNLWHVQVLIFCPISSENALLVGKLTSECSLRSFYITLGLS